MSVDEGYVLPKDDCAEIRKKREEIRKSRRGDEGGEGDVIHFERWQQPADSHTVRRMTMGYHNDLKIG